MIRFVLVPFLLFALASCQTMDENSTYYISGPEYTDIVKEHSDRVLEHYGVYIGYDIRLTYLSAKMQEARIKRLATIYKWTEQRVQQERRKARAQMKESTKFFALFNTYEKKIRTLIQGERNPWTLFMVYKGKRYKAHVRRAHLKKYQILAQYPPLDPRFYKPFYITFDLPTTGLNLKDIEVILSGPRGDPAHLSF